MGNGMMTQKSWRAVGLSSQGGSHFKTGDPCQDAHCWRRLPCGTLVVAVADGAGTAAQADVGAKLAVKTALETVCRALAESEENLKEETLNEETPKEENPKEENLKEENLKEENLKEETLNEETPKEETPKEETPKEETLKDETPKEETLNEETLKEEEWRNILAGGLAAALDALKAEAVARQSSLRDFACTLAVAVARPGQMVAAIQIGDGAVVAQADGGETFAVTRPAPSEYLNETTFLVSPGAIDGASFKLWQGNLARIAALTDGLQMLALQMPIGNPHQGFFDPLLRFVARTGNPVEAETMLQAFLDSPRVRERTDDDLTLFLASCGPENRSEG